MQQSLYLHVIFMTIPEFRVIRLGSREADRFLLDNDVHLFLIEHLAAFQKIAYLQLRFVSNKMWDPKSMDDIVPPEWRLLLRESILFWEADESPSQPTKLRQKRETATHHMLK